MLNNLLLTTLLTTGVALATPVCDAPNLQKQADNVVTNYSLTLNFQNQSITNYGGQETGYLSYTGTDKETIKNYSGTNLALNVQATHYKTQVQYTQSGTTYNFITNTEWYDTFGYIYDNATLILNVFQIDTYNYNVDTETNVTVSMNLQSGIFNLTEYEVEEEWWLKTVYTTVEDWSQYIHRQTRQFQAREILYDIEDVNNNFFYTKQTWWLDGRTQADNTEITLQPNKTNYIAIMYMPMVEASVNNQTVDASYTTLPFRDTDDLNQTNFVFTGTNIIPDGTYEVVDLPGLMWQILEMPFAFVSQAFNVTLFPGTPYQVNISNLFLSIVAIFVFVWLIGLLFKLKG